MGVPLKNFSLAIFVIVVVLCATNVSAAAASIKTDQTNYDYSCSSNGSSTIAECFGKELEFVMDSDIISTRLLLQQGGVKDPVTDVSKLKGKTIGGGCDRNKYGSCLPGPNGTKRRACQTYQKCRP